MKPEEIRLLFAYDAWANGRTLDACAALSPEQFTRDLGSSFRFRPRHRSRIFWERNGSGSSVFTAVRRSRSQRRSSSPISRRCERVGAKSSAICTLTSTGLSAADLEGEL